MAASLSEAKSHSPPGGLGGGVTMPLHMAAQYLTILQLWVENGAATCAQTSRLAQHICCPSEERTRLFGLCGALSIILGPS